MKPLINEALFIKKCNEELRKDAAYEEGMKFVAAPEDGYGEKITDIDWVGPENKVGVFARAKYRVRSRYAVEVSLN